MSLDLGQMVEETGKKENGHILKNSQLTAGTLACFLRELLK